MRLADVGHTSSTRSHRVVHDHLPLMVWEARADGLLDHFNSYVSRYCGVGADALEGVGWLSIVHPADRERVFKRWCRSVETGDPYDIEFRIRARDSSYRWFLAQAAAVSGRRGNPVRWVGACTEIGRYVPRASRGSGDVISRVLGGELQLQLWREELARQARLALIREVVGNVTHDLKQPLTSILSNAEALRALLGRSHEASAGIDEILTDIIEDDKRAVDLLREVRTLLEADSHALVGDVNEWVREVVMIEQSQLLANECRIDLKLGHALPKVLIDRTQIEIALLNLVVNAYEATADVQPSRRRIGIRTSRHAQAGVRIAVSDTGPGITGDPAKIFEPFYSTKRNRLGLGLPVCHSIVESHGGRVCFRRNEAHGTTFYIDLPSARERAENVSDALRRISGQPPTDSPATDRDDLRTNESGSGGRGSGHANTATDGSHR